MKKIKQNSAQLSPRTLGSLFKRFHLTISFILVSAMLAAVVLLINNVILNPPTATTPGGGQVDGSIVTPSPLQSFHTSDELKAPVSAPASGRQSPFTE